MTRRKRISNILLWLLLALWNSPVMAQGQLLFTRHYNDRYAQFEFSYDLDSTKIVMLGNSLTENAGDWNALLETNNVVNRGISGDDARGILHRLHQILPKKPKAIFLMCGINDLSHNLSAGQVFLKCKEVIDSIRSGAPETTLYVQSLLPFNESFGRWKTLAGRTDDVPVINQMLCDYCDIIGVTYINLFPRFTRGDSNILMPSLTVDGLHLSKTGYKIWAHLLNRYVSEINWEIPRQ
ncbi:MAG: serine acetyltransferase [Prevotella sp.]|nr:serine acetyltransferase [Prevotella sp.]